MSPVSVPLKRACTANGQYGLNFPASEYVNDGVRLVRTSDLAGGELRGENAIFVPHDAVTAEDLLEEDDLLLSRSGTIGRAYLVPREAQGMAFAGFLVRFRMRPEISPRFVYYCTQSHVFQSLVQSDAVSSTILNFNADKYGNLPIPLPSKPNQQAIADYLDRETARIDTLIDEQQRLVELLRERSQASWEEEFSQLQKSNSNVAVRRLIDSIVDGPFGSSLTSAHYSDHGTRVIRLGNIGVNEWRDDDKAYIPDSYAAELAQHAVLPGDVVVAGLGDERWPLGRAVVVPGIGAAIVKADCYRLRPGPMVLPSYLAWAMSSPSTQTQIGLLARGATRARLNTAVVQDVRLPVPPVEVQRRVVARATASRVLEGQLIAETERLIELSKERRSALITAAVTGQIDVTGKAA